VCFRQTVRELGPGVAAVAGFVHAAAGPVCLGGGVGVGGGGNLGVADEGVELIALAFPGGKQQHLGIGRMHDEVHDAGLVVEMPDALPGLAAVGGLEQAALLIR